MSLTNLTSSLFSFLGVFDPRLLTMQLKSRLPFELTHALNVLSIVAHDHPGLNLISLPDLAGAIIDYLYDCLVAERQEADDALEDTNNTKVMQIVTLTNRDVVTGSGCDVKGGKETSSSSASTAFLSYEELFDMHEGTWNEETELFHPSTPSSSSSSSSSSATTPPLLFDNGDPLSVNEVNDLRTRHDHIMCLLNIVRNCSHFTYDNQGYLLTSTRFADCLNLLIEYSVKVGPDSLYFLGKYSSTSSSPPAISNHISNPPPPLSTYNRVSSFTAHKILDYRKNVIVILAYMGFIYRIPNLKTGQLILAIIHDFIQVSDNIYSMCALDALTKLTVLHDNRTLLRDVDADTFKSLARSLLEFLPTNGVLDPLRINYNQDDVACWEMASLCLYNLMTLDYGDIRAALCGIPGIFPLLLTISRTPVFRPLVPPPPNNRKETPKEAAMRMAQVNAPTVYGFTFQRLMMVVWEACKGSDVGRQIIKQSCESTLKWMGLGCVSGNDHKAVALFPPNMYSNPRIPRIEEDVVRLAAECLHLIQE